MLMQLAVEAAAANGYVLVRKRKRKSGACRRKDKRVREEEKREEEKRARGTLVVWEPLPDVALGALPDVVAHDAVEGAPLVVIEGPAVAVNGPTNAEQVNNPGLLLYQLETINRFRIHIPVQVPFDIRIPVQVVVGAGGGGGDGDGDAVQGGIEPHNLLLLNQPVVDVPVQNVEAALREALGLDVGRVAALRARLLNIRARNAVAARPAAAPVAPTAPPNEGPTEGPTQGPA